MHPMNGSVSTLDHTREGGSAEYRCDDGFRPSAIFPSTCQSTAMWDPPPQDHYCMHVEGTVVIIKPFSSFKYIYIPSAMLGCKMWSV